MANEYRINYHCDACTRSFTVSVRKDKKERYFLKYFRYSSAAGAFVKAYDETKTTILFKYPGNEGSVAYEKYRTAICSDGIFLAQTGDTLDIVSPKYKAEDWTDEHFPQALIIVQPFLGLI